MDPIDMATTTDRWTAGVEAPKVPAAPWTARSAAWRVFSRVATGSAYLCTALTLSVWLLLVLAGDRWWAATLIQYSPRWVWLGPPLLAALLVGMARPRMLWLPLLCLLLVAGPIMGLCVPWRTLLPGSSEGELLRVMSCNCCGDRLDVERLATLIRETQTDVVLLQECHSSIAQAVAPPGWSVDNGWGLCIVSRYPFRQVDVLRRKPPGGWFDMCAHYRVETPHGAVDLFNVHLTTPRKALTTALMHNRTTPVELDANSAVRRFESRVISQCIFEHKASAIIAGDFNLPPESAIFRQYWSEYQDAFSTAGVGWGYTKFTRWHGVRIDHILAGSDWRVERSWIGPNVGSDHRPLIAELRLKK
jgi:endonuclease/exonuclease/phosphatase (EEP) superfamily protein YafD